MLQCFYKIFLNLVFCSPDIIQHKYVTLRAQEAVYLPFPSSSVAPDPLPSAALACWDIDVLPYMTVSSQYL